MKEALVSEKQRKIPKPNNIVSIPTQSEDDFFKWWCVLMRLFVNITNKEADIIACFLKKRWELSKQISDPVLLDSVLMGKEVRKSIIEECGMTLPHYYVLMGKLKKSNVITSSGINPRLIPNIRQDDNGIFQLLVLFKEESKKK